MSEQPTEDHIEDVLRDVLARHGYQMLAQSPVVESLVGAVQELLGSPRTVTAVYADAEGSMLLAGRAGNIVIVSGEAKVPVLHLDILFKRLRAVADGRDPEAV